MFAKAGVSMREYKSWGLQESNCWNINLLAELENLSSPVDMW